MIYGDYDLREKSVYLLSIYVNSKFWIPVKWDEWGHIFLYIYSS